MDFDFFNKKKTKSVKEFGNIKIDENAIYYDDVAIQTSNITRTWITKYQKKPFPKWTIVGILAALLLFSSKNLVLILIGIVIGAISGYIIYKHLFAYTDKYGLRIEMTSGSIYILSSYDLLFLRCVQTEITNDFIGRSSGAVINMDNKTIIHNNGIVSYGDNANNQNTIVEDKNDRR